MRAAVIMANFDTSPYHDKSKINVHQRKGMFGSFAVRELFEPGHVGILGTFLMKTINRRPSLMITSYWFFVLFVVV